MKWSSEEKRCSGDNQLILIILCELDIEILCCINIFSASGVSNLKVGVVKLNLKLVRTCPKFYEFST